MEASAPSGGRTEISVTNQFDDTQAVVRAFGLREQPFAPTADPTYFYGTGEHRSCLVRLWNSIDEQHGIAVVLGNYGTGKTTLLRKLITGMMAAPDRYTVAVVGSPIPSWTTFALLEAIVRQFGLTPPSRTFTTYLEALNGYLLENRSKITTLIIDDAQNLNKRGQIELLRLAQNLETPQHKLLNLVCFAQMEWARILQAAPNFEQRINFTFTLDRLGETEVQEFIQFRLTRAGARPGSGPSFSESAVAMIHAYSDGNPRVIVTLCRNALLLAAQTKTTSVGDDIVLHTIERTTMPDEIRLQRAIAATVPYGHTVVAREAIAAAGAPRASILAAATPRPKDVVIPSTRGTGRHDRANELLIRAANRD